MYILGHSMNLKDTEKLWNNHVYMIEYIGLFILNITWKILIHVI